MNFFSPSSAIGRLRQALLDLIREHEEKDELPTSARFLFYELEQRGGIEKKRAGINPKTGLPYVRPPVTDVIDALTDLREEGFVPWDWITDETRDVIEPPFAATVADYVQERVETARIDLWDGEPPPLILCESRAVGGALTDLAYEYLTPLAPTAGMVGGFLVTQVAPLLAEDERVVLYIGDWEVGAAGEFIETSARRYFEEHAGRPIDWTRVALTGEQVEADPRLSGLVIEKTDNRFRPARSYQAVEAEALGQGVLVGIVRAYLDRMLDERGIDRDHVQERETEERRQVAEFLARLGDG
jgi:hypothetical protein